MSPPFNKYIIFIQNNSQCPYNGPKAFQDLISSSFLWIYFVIYPLRSAHFSHSGLLAVAWPFQSFFPPQSFCPCSSHASVPPHLCLISSLLKCTLSLRLISNISYPGLNKHFAILAFTLKFNSLSGLLQCISFG